MTQFGSLQNQMLAEMKNTPQPAPGMGATLICYTDRAPYEITRVNARGNRLWAKPCRVRAAQENPPMGHQDWQIDPPSKWSPEEEFYLSKKGVWHPIKDTTRSLLIGVQNRYFDWSF